MAAAKDSKDDNGVDLLFKLQSLLVAKDEEIYRLKSIVQSVTEELADLKKQSSKKSSKPVKRQPSVASSQGSKNSIPREEPEHSIEAVVKSVAGTATPPIIMSSSRFRTDVNVQNNNGTQLLHPPGTSPGGTWYKQTYRGSQTTYQTNKTSVEAGLVAKLNLDERLVYHDAVSNRYCNANGTFVDATKGTFTALPPGVDVMASALRPGALVTREANMQRDAGVKLPPGTRAGGRWYKQYMPSGEERMVYREDPTGKRFVTEEGEPVKPSRTTCFTPCLGADAF